MHQWPRPAALVDAFAGYPIIADGRLYIRDGDSLWCYDIKETRREN